MSILKERLTAVLACDNRSHYDESCINEISDIICSVFGVSENEVCDIRLQKSGMTNSSFSFVINNVGYIMRIPGKGTSKLINRRNEGRVYEVIGEYGLSDRVLYFDKENGYKITERIEGVHNMNPRSSEELARGMRMLRSFHRKKLQVEHFFDVFDMIDYYEKLRGGKSVYKDYNQTKAAVFLLKAMISGYDIDYRLCHIDSVCDNFLIGNDDDRVYLIDFEYSAMQDPDLDIAMFALYAMYDRAAVDRLIDIYYEGGCPVDIRYKIYAYMSIAGLLWSNWCEYKMTVGVEFKGYAAFQYDCAKKYYAIVKNESASMPELSFVRSRLW